jgi:hypothetical protein
MTLTARQQSIKDEFIRVRNTWSPQWESILRMDCEFLNAYLHLSAVPLRHNYLDNKVKEFASFKSRVGGLAGQVRASARRSEHLTRVEKVSWDTAGCGRMRQPALQDNANADEPDPTL